MQKGKLVVQDQRYCDLAKDAPAEPLIIPDVSTQDSLNAVPYQLRM